jgi:hypothetical protein
VSAKKFSPSIVGISEVGFRPYMVESAYDYYKVSTTSPHQRMGIQNVMCALSIEIILKSFYSAVTSNHGKPNETYKFSRTDALPKKFKGHDLFELYEALPGNIQNYLFSSEDLKTLKLNKDLFTNSRYAYELNANKSHNDGIIKLAASLICKMVFLYRELGCDDPFIKGFDIEGLYFSDVQRFVLVHVPQ